MPGRLNLTLFQRIDDKHIRDLLRLRSRAQFLDLFPISMQLLRFIRLGEIRSSGHALQCIIGLDKVAERAVKSFDFTCPHS